MDPVTMGGVLAAVAGGAGGALGGQVWAGLSALVRRPFRQVHRVAGMAKMPSGEVELAALERSPADQRRAVALAEVLVARAGADTQFEEALQAWWEQASQIRIGGDVSNTISGGTQYGPVLQGRDFTALTFGSPVAPPDLPATEPDA